MIKCEKFKFNDNGSIYHHINGRDYYNDNHKFLNYRKKWNQQPKDFESGTFPLFIDIEVTNACNLRCKFCPTGLNLCSTNKGFISEDIVRNIIDEGSKNGLYGVKFNVRGEPLLHPELCSFIKYAKDKGLVDVYFNTNALFLTENICQCLIESHLDRISISFEGYTKKVYEQYRVGSNYEKVLKNIKILQDMKYKLKVNYPIVRVQTVILPNNVFDINEYNQFWSSRVDEVGCLEYQDVNIDNKNIIDSSWSCPQLWQRMSVLWDGTILPCNYHGEHLLNLGNITNCSIKEYWNSDNLNNIRDIHKKGISHTIESCNNCYLRRSSIIKYKERV